MAEPRRAPKIMAVANQKGGVGKTTTAINLGAALARRDRRVLLVDLDPQGNASTGLGAPPEDRHVTSYDLLLGEATPQEAVRETTSPNLLLVPSTSDLSAADLELGQRQGRTQLLRGALRQPLMADLDLDYILIDCPPSLNILTINALVAAQSVLVPLQSEFFALEGLSQLMLTIREVRQTANPSLRIEGVALTMVDRRTSLAQQVEADARENLGTLVFQTVIPRNVRLSEAPSHAQSVLDYDPSSAGANAYRALAAELLARET
ncbi:Chromosome (plasmid) partitioning protein ParA / Sporulation initiation inhibitor protein Soj [Rubellimicrobium mesophilum DSM 19309]|uniref:Chromosome partitioning protein ParA n=1 Tax=Rubellimicrobium mesophilum DSM 19309 TaxID=442562 RepID=A0A017HIK3_9RHOB|nr:ParA family protein [Rubellimicrobium mesophilum]EYD74150.1 Chromosome (plasmid) partitioning protein ParA / Sporulation initiation inhibitor protein Soj [Rubellimicrobium mesophilum DSM 19309]